MSRSKHATAFNEQAGIQRDAIAPNDSDLGASRTTMSTIFSGAPTPGYIMDEALKRFTATSSSVSEIPNGENFDFFNGISKEELLLFKNGENKFGDISTKADKPNQFGPNLAVPNIDSAPLDDTQEIPAAEPVSSPTFESIGSAGFGASIDRNNPDTSLTSTNKLDYLTRRGVGAVPGDAGSYTSRSSGQNILGEYIDSSTYAYNQPADNEP